MLVEIIGFIQTGETLRKAEVLVAVEPAPLSRVIEHLFHGWSKSQIVECLKDGAALVRKTSRLRPKLIVANIRWLGQDASRIIHKVKLSSPGSKLIITGFPQGFRQHAREWGADAYLEEEDLVRRLVPTAQRLLSQQSVTPKKSAVQRRRPTSSFNDTISARPSRGKRPC